MKHLLLVLLLCPAVLFGQSVKASWSTILKEKNLAVYFQGMWESLGINIEETGEKITILHHKDHFEMLDGVDDETVDYNVFLKLENVINMAAHGEDGEIDAYESYKIMSVLFTPFVQATLMHPMMNKSCQMKMANIENHVHVYLKSPTNDEFVTHTMIFINKQWVVIPGIHGVAERVFHITPAQAIDYQKEAYSAQKVNTRKSWKKFKKFYLIWRKTVSEGLK